MGSYSAIKRNMQQQGQISEVLHSVKEASSKAMVIPYIGHSGKGKTIGAEN